MKGLLLLFAICKLMGHVHGLMKVTGGSVVALVTPMTPSNSVDIGKFTNLLEWHVQQGTSGAVILGTTGGEWRNPCIFTNINACIHTYIHTHISTYPSVQSESKYPVILYHYIIYNN